MVFKVDRNQWTEFDWNIQYDFKNLYHVNCHILKGSFGFEMGLWWTWIGFTKNRTWQCIISKYPINVLLICNSWTSCVLLSCLSNQFYQNIYITTDYMLAVNGCVLCVCLYCWPKSLPHHCRQLYAPVSVWSQLITWNYHPAALASQTILEWEAAWNGSMCNIPGGMI